jgi:hypothetical protein
VREQVELLEHHANLAAHRVDRLLAVVQPMAGDGDLAALDRFKMVDAADQRRLARARGATEHDLLALGHVEIDVLQGMEGAIVFLDMPHLDHRRGSAFGAVGLGHGHPLISPPRPPSSARACGPRARAASTGEIHRPDHAEDEQRLVDLVGHDRAGPGQLDEADDRGERGPLEQLHEEADGRRQRQFEGLRHDHVEHAAAGGEAESICRLALAARHRLDRAAPDLAEEGRGMRRQRH